MALVQTAPSVGAATKADDGIAWRDNDRICGIPVVAGAPLLVGGSHEALIADTAFVRLPWCGAFEIDGALTQYASVYLEADAISAPGAPSVVATFDLWDDTTGATVAGSSLAITVNVANPLTKPGKTSAFTINAGVKRYYFRVKTGTAGIYVGGFCKLVAKSS